MRSVDYIILHESAAGNKQEALAGECERFVSVICTQRTFYLESTHSLSFWREGGGGGWVAASVNSVPKIIKSQPMTTVYFDLAD